MHVPPWSRGLTGKPTVNGALMNARCCFLVAAAVWRYCYSEIVLEALT